MGLPPPPNQGHSFNQRCPNATLINLRLRQLRWRIIVALRRKLISLHKYGVKVTLIYA
jgi:hypothetical protein